MPSLLSSTSSASASRAIIVMSSSFLSGASTTTTAFLAKRYATAFGPASEPPARSKMWRISADVLFLLSVTISSITAEPPGP